MLSAEQHDSQSEETNVIDESQAEKRPMPVQEAGTDKSAILFVVLTRGRPRDSPRSPLPVSSQDYPNISGWP